MYLCSKCGLWTAQYNYKLKAFICTDEMCKHEEYMKPQIKKCSQCGKNYMYWTTFDGSRCSYCGKSFVE